MLDQIHDRHGMETTLDNGDVIRVWKADDLGAGKYRVVKFPGGHWMSDDCGVIMDNAVDLVMSLIQPDPSRWKRKIDMYDGKLQE